MRFNHILYQKFRFVFVILLSVSLTGTLIAQDKPEKKDATVSVILKVTDDQGKPVPNAKVVVGEGMIYAQTDENGSLLIKAYQRDFVAISATGYERSVSTIKDIVLNNTVRLIKSKLFMTYNDNVPLPFLTMKKRHITGSEYVITGNQLEKYPSTDLRNTFAGLVPGLQITERHGAPGLTAEEELGNYRITEKIGVAARGRSMMYIIDDIPVGVNEMPLDPYEIESVTVIKDIAGKAMYGPLGADGIIYIKTKRGRPNERILNVNMEDGISIIDRMPGTVSGADYARLNNIAREADGLTPNYDNDDIEAYAKNDPYDMYHPSVNYKEMMLKNSMPFRRANVSSTGGNDVVQYYSYLGYSGEGDIYKIGPKADYNRINTRSNIDIKINDRIKVQFDFYAGLTYRRSPNYGYSSTFGEGGSQMDLLELSSALPNIYNTPPIAFPVYANNDPTLEKPYYAVSATYPNNPIGNLVGNGYYTESGRTGSLTAAVDYNLSNVIKGLKSRTYVSYDGLNVLRVGKAENYIAYIATPSQTVSGNDTIKLAKVHDGLDSPNMSNLHDYYYQGFSVYENLSYNRSFGNHNVQSALTYNIFRISKNGIEEPQRTQSGIWTGMYSYDDKYSILGVLNYAGTYTLDKNNRYQLFPSLGASWVMSEENFMSNLTFINYLKLHAEAGILGYENFMSPFYYRDRWNISTGSVFGAYSTNQWFGSTTDNLAYRTYAGKIGNPELTWEKRKEVSIGLDGLILNQKLSFEFNYYNNLRDGQVSQLPNSMPYYLGIWSALPRINYNKTRYSGIEMGIQFTDNSGIIKYSIGGNATVQNSKIVKNDELEYRFEYQKRLGRSVDTYWGQKCIGKFQSDEEALEVPQMYDAVLKEGDLKYADMNGDGFIDDNDMSAIGNTTPRLFYALNAKFSFKNFDMTVIGTGCAFYDIALTNSYFWNGWGDNNYSNFVKDNIGGAYPRLTYYKVNNNFVASDFWLTKGGYFKIQNIELAYNVPLEKLQIIHSRGMRIYVRGANLLTISQVKDVDPESISSGISTYPLFKTFTGGIKLTF
ncbi:MAG: SusC/RagA family TonB-linked outer membrane protein [Bacteroidales bacterium]|nr:SusC/RagA family TonB-linked outer membrane protein [Bacteroidales bacterium]